MATSCLPPAYCPLHSSHLHIDCIHDYTSHDTLLTIFTHRAYLMPMPCLLPAVFLPNSCSVPQSCVDKGLPTFCLRSAYVLPTVCILPTYCMTTFCLLSAYCLPTLCLLSAYCLPTACLRSAYCLPTVCLLSAYCLAKVCRLHAYLMLSPRLLRSS